MTDQGAGAASGKAGMSVNVTYFKVPSGILKIAQFALSFLTMICTFAQPGYGHWTLGSQGGGWVGFTALTAVILSAVLILVYLFRINEKIPRQVPLQIIVTGYLAAYAVFYFMCLIICAVYAGKNAGGYGSFDAVAAAAFFSAMCMLVYAGDAVLSFLTFKRGGDGGTDAATAPPPGDIGTSDITPGVYAGSDLRNPEPVY